MVIGVKNPYLKVSFNGKISLRNDNPENIIFKKDNHGIPSSLSPSFDELKERGNIYYINGEYESGLG